MMMIKARPGDELLSAEMRKEIVLMKDSKESRASFIENRIAEATAEARAEEAATAARKAQRRSRQGPRGKHQMPRKNHGYGKSGPLILNCRYRKKKSGRFGLRYRL
jgi:hypothetical protein